MLLGRLRLLAALQMARESQASKSPPPSTRMFFWLFLLFEECSPFFRKPPLPIKKPSRCVVFGEGDFLAFDPLFYLLAVHSADANLGLEASLERQNRHGRVFFEIIEGAKFKNGF